MRAEKRRWAFGLCALPTCAPGTGDLDLLFLIDSSGSMSEEQTSLICLRRGAASR